MGEHDGKRDVATEVCRCRGGAHTATADDGVRRRVNDLQAVATHARPSHVHRLRRAHQIGQVQRCGPGHLPLHDELRPDRQITGTGSGRAAVVVEPVSGVADGALAVSAVQPPATRLTKAAAIAAERIRDVTSGVSDHGRKRWQGGGSAAHCGHAAVRRVLALCRVHAAAPRTMGEPADALCEWDSSGPAQRGGRRLRMRDDGGRNTVLQRWAPGDERRKFPPLTSVAAASVAASGAGCDGVRAAESVRLHHG